MLLVATTGSGDCESADEHGHAFRTCFTPDGFALGAEALGRGGAAIALAPALSADLTLRRARLSNSKEGSLWFSEHRFADTLIQPAASERLLLVVGYEGLLRRHLEEGFVLIPTASPVRIPFPFDVAVSLSGGRYERRVWEGRGYTLEVARAAVLLDPLRSEDGRVRAGVGPALTYTIRSDGVTLAHEIGPLTGAQIESSYQSVDGLWSARALGIAGWVYSPTRPAAFRARGEAVIERVVVAVNDLPLSVRIMGTGSLNDAGVRRISEWTLSAGLAVRPWQ